VNAAAPGGSGTGSNADAGGGPVRDLSDFLSRWSAQHGGASATGLVGRWLGLVYSVARRIVGPLRRRGLGPDAVTWLGLFVALTVPALTAVGGRWVLLAALAVAVSGLLDSLDGAVALLTGKGSSWGKVLDSVCDRVSDSAYLLAFWFLGAPWQLVLAAWFLSWMLEYVRARACAAGMVEVGVVSVGERPTRIITTVMFLLSAGLFDGIAAGWAFAGSGVWVVTGAIGLSQVWEAARAHLRP
jgi:phosphatidylglycerophosphate synthase